MTASWFGVAVIAGVAGTAIGWAVEAMWVESLGLSGWIVSMAWVAVAALAPIAGAAALMGGQGVPPLYRVMGPVARWPRDRRAVAAGLALAALVVLTIQTAMMLVFDPRYVDFPFAQLIGGLVPFVVLALRRQSRVKAPGGKDRRPHPGAVGGLHPAQRRGHQLAGPQLLPGPGGAGPYPGERAGRARLSTSKPTARPAMSPFCITSPKPAAPRARAKSRTDGHSRCRLAADQGHCAKGPLVEEQDTPIQGRTEPGIQTLLAGHKDLGIFYDPVAQIVGVEDRAESDRDQPVHLAGAGLETLSHRKP
jgi:hypothetical protein